MRENHLHLHSVIDKEGIGVINLFGVEGAEQHIDMGIIIIL